MELESPEKLRLMRYRSMTQDLDVKEVVAQDEILMATLERERQKLMEGLIWNQRRAQRRHILELLVSVALAVVPVLVVSLSRSHSDAGHDGSRYLAILAVAGTILGVFIGSILVRVTSHQATEQLYETRMRFQKATDELVHAQPEPSGG